MSESHPSDEHHGPTVQTYFYVFGALAVFTLVSFVANLAVRHEIIATHTSFVIILAVAVCKTLLVASFFMHLILDWRRVYIMIVPALILAPMLMIVLLPDIVLAWHYSGITVVP